jgi:predicted Zn-dependent peptidase
VAVRCRCAAWLLGWRVTGRAVLPCLCLRAKVSTIALYVDAGSAAQSEEDVGAAHFLENLAFKSTTTKSQEEIARCVVVVTASAARCCTLLRVASLCAVAACEVRWLRVCRAGVEKGIATSVGLFRDLMFYRVDVLRSSLEPALEMLADTVLHPAFTPDEMRMCQVWYCSLVWMLRVQRRESPCRCRGCLLLLCSK